MEHLLRGQDTIFQHVQWEVYNVPPLMIPAQNGGEPLEMCCKIMKIPLPNVKHIRSTSKHLR